MRASAGVLIRLIYVVKGGRGLNNGGCSNWLRGWAR